MDSLNTSSDQSLVSSFICLMVTLGIFLVMCGSIGIFFAIEKDIYTPPDTQRQSGNLMICGKVSYIATIPILDWYHLKPKRLVTLSFGLIKMFVNFIRKKINTI